MSPSGAWVAGMLGSLYVQTADLEYSEDRESACGHYGKAVEIFESVTGSDHAPRTTRPYSSARGTASPPAEAGPEFQRLRRGGFASF